MKAIVPEPIEAYAAAHTDPLHPVYDALREVTYARTAAPQMQVGHLEGRFLKLLAQLTGARRVVEFGTFTGYSALCMAEGMADDGVLYTLDVNPDTTAIAQAHWARVLDYHALPAEPALATVTAVRANTVPLLRGLPEAAWTRQGTHTESGAYTAEDWLRIYAEHLEKHSGQIERVLEAWKARGSRG